jgi:hypothetical protein
MSAFLAGVGTIAELFQFLWLRQHWGLLPIVLLLLLFGLIIILGSAAGVGPFVYTIF